MKRLALLLALLLAAPSALGQSVGASQIRKKANAGLVADAANALAVGIYRGTTAPASPVTGQAWLDTTATPAILRTWNGSAWEAPPSATAVTPADFSALPATPRPGPPPRGRPPLPQPPGPRGPAPPPSRGGGAPPRPRRPRPPGRGPAGRGGLPRARPP